MADDTVYLWTADNPEELSGICLDETDAVKTCEEAFKGGRAALALIEQAKVVTYWADAMPGVPRHLSSRYDRTGSGQAGVWDTEKSEAYWEPFEFAEQAKVIAS